MMFGQHTIIKCIVFLCSALIALNMYIFCKERKCFMVGYVEKCDSSCQTFKSNFSVTFGKPKAAIYFLTKSSRLNELRRSLMSLDKHFNNKYKYPVIIFQENDISSGMLEGVTTSTVFLQNVSFSIPTFLPEPVPNESSCIKDPSLTRRHSFRFHAKQVFEHPIMGNLDFYWRFDDDSQLLSDVPYDIFKYMKEHHYEFGYITKNTETCTFGLRNTTQEFLNKHNIEIAHAFEKIP